MYPPHHLGGYELVWRSAMNDLRRRGHLVRVVATDFRTDSSAPDDPDTYRDLRWYWKEHDWPRLSWRARLGLERHNHAVLERHLAELRPDVVSWWSMGGMSLALIEQVRRAGIPAVAFVHDEWLVYGPRVDRWTRLFAGRPWLGGLARRLTGVPTRADVDSAVKCVLVSETVRGHAREEGYTLNGSSIAPSGIDAELFEPAEERAWDARLLYVGRIDERKGLADAVAALAGLPPETTLTVVGSGERSEVVRIEGLAAELGVDQRVLWRGICARAGLPEIYASADAVLFPVRWEEPWGLVPLEAMAVGRPVIATGRGGSGEYLRDGANCLLVPAADPLAIAQAVQRLARDPSLRQRLRQGGLQTAGRYTEAAFNEVVLRSLSDAAARDVRS